MESQDPNYSLFATFRAAISLPFALVVISAATLGVLLRQHRTGELPSDRELETLGQEKLGPLFQAPTPEFVGALMWFSGMWMMQAWLGF